jgi:hypothetical protein
MSAATTGFFEKNLRNMTMDYWDYSNFSGHRPRKSMMHQRFRQHPGTGVSHHLLMAHELMFETWNHHDQRFQYHMLKTLVKPPFMMVNSPSLMVN